MAHIIRQVDKGICSFRCGWCGRPCNEDGSILDEEEAPRLSEEQLSNAESVHGDCCRAENEPFQRMRVTRDMAIDAQDLSLEGELW